MTPVRIALVGAGAIGRRHLGVLFDDPAYSVAGIADVTPAAEAFARDRDIAYSNDAAALLDETKPDGVIVAVPNRLHGAVARLAIERGIPVLLEKPVADTLADALSIVDAAAANGVPVLVGHHRRHNPIVQRAAELVAAGAIGPLRAVVCAWLAHKPIHYFHRAWRREPGAGPVLVNAIHDIDALRAICGEIEAVQAVCAGTAREHAVEDTAAATVRFRGGALGTLLVSDSVSSPFNWEWTSRENPDFPHEPQSCYTLAGARGTLVVPSLELWRQDEGKGWLDPLVRERIHVRHTDPYVQQMRNFADVIAGRAEPLISAAEGARTLAATLAIHASADSGTRVVVDDLVAAARAAMEPAR